MSVRRLMGEDCGDDRDRDALRSMKIQRSSIVHVSQGKPSILIHFLFLARVVISDRMDSGPRDRSRLDRIQHLARRHVSCKKEKPCGNIVPRGRNNGRCSG